MTDASLVTLFVRPLNQLRIPYMVAGGVASVIYGEPRLTRDIDLVVNLRPSDATRFAASWTSADFYVPPVEVIEVESGRAAHGHFNVTHHDTSLRADVYLPGNDALTAWAFANTLVRRVDDDDVSLAPIEAVIVSKLRYYQMGGSDRHLRDINQMLRISASLVRHREVDTWVDRLGLQQEWRMAHEFREPR
jgi:hypothetical protein